MARSKKPPELTFQQHIADFLVREHGYGVLEQTDITDTEHCIAEDQLWPSSRPRRPITLKKLTDDYGTDARDEIFRALRKELERTPLWMILRARAQGARAGVPAVLPEAALGRERRGEEVRQEPHHLPARTSTSARPTQEIDFVFFLNGLPIVALEVKHEKNQNVHDAVAQFAARDHHATNLPASLPLSGRRYQRRHGGDRPAPGRELPLAQQRADQHAARPRTSIRSSSCTAKCCRRTTCSKRCRSSWSACPSAKPRRTSRSAGLHHLAPLSPEPHGAEGGRRRRWRTSPTTGDIGRKYLINHSAGSGKTLSICWLADRLHSLFKPGTNEKLVDIVFILTDRKSLDTNIRRGHREVHPPEGCGRDSRKRRTTCRDS